jgi:prepilin-type N-terminal cleavage/methylation domain-containing protein
MKKGFTLIELLVVMGIIGILATAVLIAVNPARQFASARDTQRRSDLYSITNAIYQYSVEHNGRFPDVIPDTPTIIGTDPGLINLTSFIVPTYIAAMPKNPSGGTDSNTGYYINFDENRRLLATTASELNINEVIRVTR